MLEQENYQSFNAQGGLFDADLVELDQSSSDTEVFLRFKTHLSMSAVPSDLLEIKTYDNNVLCEL